MHLNWFGLIPLSAILMGCWQSKPGDDHAERKAARIDRARAETQKPLNPNVQAVGSNQLLTLEIPVADASGFLEVQRCFIWRDMELKTAAMSCPGQTEIPTDK